MNEFHGVGICHITPSINNEFHKKWACLDIVDEIREPFPWPLIYVVIKTKLGLRL
jgi:hypothetical protein